MTVVPQLTIAGNNDLASETARHALASGIANPVYLWRDIRDPLPAPTAMIVLAESGERAGFARSAVESGMIAVSLPIPDPEPDLVRAVESGKLREISGLHGVPALNRLHRDACNGREGRRYGIYAAHRIPRNHAHRAGTALIDLVAFVASLGDGGVEHVRATSDDFGGNTVGWFVLARFASGTIATLEVSAVLPESETPDGEVLIEVTGSGSVLRAEPERQSVVVTGQSGVHRQAWYDDPVGPLLERAMEMVEHDAVDEQVAGLKLMETLRTAAASDWLVRPE